MSGNKGYCERKKAEERAAAEQRAAVENNRAAVREKLTAFLCGLLGWQSLDEQADAAITAAMSGQIVDIQALEEYLASWAENRTQETEVADV